MLEQIEAVIFDMDGTLVDSMWVWTAIDQEYIDNYHLTVPEDFHTAIEGMSYTETAQYFLDSFPQLPHTLDEIKQEWFQMSLDKYTHDVHLKEGAETFIREIRRRGIRTGIATSNDRKLVEQSLQAMGVAGLFDTISTGCQVKRGKPAPDVYLKAAENLKTPPRECLVFEDVPMGILAGKNAGMKVCAVDDWFSRPQEAKKRQLADYYTHHYDEILNHTFEVLG